MSSGSAVTADLRCSTFPSGTAITVRPSCARRNAAGGCPRRWSARRALRTRCGRPAAHLRRPESLGRGSRRCASPATGRFRRRRALRLTPGGLPPPARGCGGPAPQPPRQMEAARPPGRAQIDSLVLHGTPRQVLDGARMHHAAGADTSASRSSPARARHRWQATEPAPGSCRLQPQGDQGLFTASTGELRGTTRLASAHASGSPVPVPARAHNACVSFDHGDTRYLFWAPDQGRGPTQKRRVSRIQRC